MPGVSFVGGPSLVASLGLSTRPTPPVQMRVVDSATGGAESFVGAVTVAALLTTAIVGGLATSNVLRLPGLTTSSIAVSWSASLADGTNDAAAEYDLRCRVAGRTPGPR